jgi:hypothetical protein
MSINHEISLKVFIANSTPSTIKAKMITRPKNDHIIKPVEIVIGMIFIRS